MTEWFRTAAATYRTGDIAGEARRFMVLDVAGKPETVPQRVGTYDPATRLIWTGDGFEWRKIRQV